MNGWPIVGWAALVVVAASAATLGVQGAGEEGLRAVIRLTARTSFLLFNAAFAASALARRWPGRFTRWLLANRRQVGVSFAVSHLVHLVAILALTRYAVLFDDSAVIIAALGYVAVAAMTVTSFDRTAAWLGGLLKTRGSDIFRMKGIVEVAGESRRVVFQGVHMLFEGKPDRPWRDGEDRTCRIVFIGRGLDAGALRSSLRECKK